MPRYALQIEYVHTDPMHRGRGMAASLIQAHLEKAGTRKAQVQAFAE